MIVIAIAVAQAMARKRRREALLAKYGDSAVVDMLMAGKVWQGMSEEQLIDTWGRPVAIDEKVYKTKTAHTFKCGQMRKDRFASRVRLENGYVVGWEQT